MAAKDTGALVWELTALAPDLTGAQKLEDTIYKLPGAAQAEQDKTQQETLRLKKLLFAAKAGQLIPESETSTPALDVVKRESSALAMKVMALGDTYKGPKAEEVKALARQLPRATKVEREPAETEIKRLQTAIVALNEKTDGLSRLGTVSTLPLKSETAEPKSDAKKYGEDRERENHKREVAKSSTVPLGPAAMRATNDGGAEKRKNLEADQSRSRQPLHSADIASRRLSNPQPSPSSSFGADRLPNEGRDPSAREGRSDRESSSTTTSALVPQPTGRRADCYRPSRSAPGPDRRQSIPKDPRPEARDRDRRKRESSVSGATVEAPLPVKRQRTVITSFNCRLVCGHCRFYGLECNGMPRCHQCAGLCVYHKCARGESCGDQKCTMIHPQQWENKEGGEYMIQGLNIHSQATKDGRE